MTGQNGCCDADLLGSDLTDTALQLAAAGFAALWRGERLTPADLLPTRTDASTAALELATLGRAELDAEHRLVGIHGLTLRPSRHHVTVGRQTHHTWCAFDSVGIPAALDLDAVARTDCPACDRELQVDIRHGVPDNGHAVLWIPTGPVSNLMAEFCAAADLYCNVEHLERVIDTRVAGSVADLEAAAALGRDTWADIAALPDSLSSAGAP